MNMKKFLAILLTLCMILSVCLCFHQQGSRNH